MNPHARTPQRSGDEEPTRKPDSTVTGSTGDSGTDDAEARRHAAAHARSSADHQSRADAALGDADAARGRAAEADGRGDVATAGMEWSDAAGLDGLAAHEATTSTIESRAAAAATKSTTVPAGGRPDRAEAAARRPPHQQGRGRAGRRRRRPEPDAATSRNAHGACRRAGGKKSLRPFGLYR